MNDFYKEVTYEQATKLLRSRLDEIKRRAIKNNYDFDLELYDLSILLALPCDYCGSASTGLDRKDNSKGYTRNNVTPCCRRCNTIKGNIYDYQEMKELGYEIMVSDAGSVYD